MIILSTARRRRGSFSKLSFYQENKLNLNLFFRPKGVKSEGGRASNISEPDGPTTVLVNLFVRSFEKIDDVKMEFSVQITFRQQWNDNRWWHNKKLINNKNKSSARFDKISLSFILIRPIGSFEDYKFEEWSKGHLLCFLTYNHDKTN